MNRLQKWVYGNWSVPVVSGVLIIISFAIQWLAGGVANLTVSPQWWLDAGAHATHASAAFTLGDVFMIAAAVVAGYGIVVKAVRALIAKVVGIDLLVSVAAIGAVIIGNFWEAAAVTFLFAIGHALEAATLNKTRSALAELVAVAPDSAIVVRDGEQQEIPAGQVRMGEIVLVKNGAKVPVDGQVVSGTGAIDEASITGESIPVEKTKGGQVFAGTVSRGGFLQVLATGIGADTTLARIIHRVEEAQDAKAKTQAFIDRFSTWYTPAVMVLALVAGLISGDVVLALTLLVIGCPGALVISIPVAIVAGIGRAARNGILIKGGEFLETSAKITAVAVDKTGTLTEGKPQLTDVIILDSTLDRTEVLRWAAAAEAGSEHPLARPILETAREEGVAPQGIPGAVTPVPGKGIVANVNGRQVLIGNPPLLEQYGIASGIAEAAQAAQDLAAAGKTPMIVAVDGRVIGVVAVADQIRQDAPEMVARLHRAGVEKVVMLTGDTRLVAEAVGKATGIDEIHASLLPEDKLDAVTELQRQGHTIAMVGDGVNDAPALATANIGVAMGAAGSAVAVETADIALMGDNLLKLPEAIGLAKRTVNVMKQNIAIALITVVLLLAGVFAGGVTMSIGMLVHEASVLVVIANAMRLLRNTRDSTTMPKSERTIGTAAEQVAA
ncbi:MULTISPECIES: cation-translocating P-type ATPase [Micrococcales]|uniref:Haloacid dehalogenase n=1 Tax=Sediminivirga luteola TaxID=1774748 RepID=A0A8J2U132_9MICO|nr:MULTISPECIES: cation-translocating P-type ATPase [Micrococcales]MAB81655.1 heavy metal translocating P-type ATPase [Planctomycetota bacterium]PZP25081.1 MAG: cadmium-translocating P-type ATPase [Kocuria rhizophila]ALJ20599.1 HAD family hydrolase [Microbacterium sp. No. 7]ALJ22421.1 HAD family hydrolase [Microbacterium sp. No. 7]MAM55087.1 heavy metal translocating P-type ATPase [Microbacterium sp.]